jgi:hypothetical protein
MDPFGLTYHLDLSQVGVFQYLNEVSSLILGISCFNQEITPEDVILNGARGEESGWWEKEVLQGGKRDPARSLS